MNRRAFLQLALLALAGCAAPPTAAATQRAPTRLPTLAAVSPEACHPEPVAVPTRAAPLAHLESTDDVGLHVISSTAAVVLDPLSYRLIVTGRVDNPLELTLDELRCMPKVTNTVRLTCQGFFTDTSRYTGVPLQHILQLAQLQDGVNGLRLTGAEGYSDFVPLPEALQAGNLLAYQLEDQPLPIYHGFPLRAVIPGLLGHAWTKYLVEIAVE